LLPLARLMLGATLLLAACETTAERINDGDGGETVTVRLIVEGTGKAQVTYGTLSSTSQKTVSLPWSKSVELDATLDVATLLAQREGGGQGAIECRIESASGSVLEQAEASGPYAICDVSAG
jgi:hypothetical protein